MFEWNKGDLNDEQEIALKEEGNILLVACPGSGKTRTLIYKIAYELSKLKEEKKFIVAITYTNNAAEEIKERVESLGIETNQLWIGTIHSFCTEWILRPYYLYLEELKYGFRILNSHEKEDILLDILVDFKNIKVYDFDFYASSEELKIKCTASNKVEDVKKILCSYLKILKDKRVIDFEQILYYSFKLLNENVFISKILTNLFPYILVDEYQDTKQIQYQILAKIFKFSENRTKLFIVGDPNQSIYSSLGGFPMGKENIENLFGIPIKNYSLSKNYRSSEKIVSYFDKYKTHDNNVIAFGKFSLHESVVSYNKNIELNNLTNEIVKLINRVIEIKKISQHEICIVAPQWIHLAPITRSLMVKLPSLSFNGPGMAPFSRDIDNFWYKVSRLILTEPNPSLYIKRRRWSKEILNELENLGLELTLTTDRDFLKICNAININETDGLEYLRKSFSIILEKLYISLELYPTLVEHYNSFFESSYRRINKLKVEGLQGISSIESFRKVFKQKAGITISTIHGVKGEEYDVVIGFGLLQGYIPHFYEEDSLNRAKRMLYVLCSRARKHLYLISEQGRKTKKGIQYKPTQILENLSYLYDKFDE